MDLILDADLIRCETSTPDLHDARVFAEAIHEEYPGKLPADNRTPAFNWKRHLAHPTVRGLQEELAATGYKSPFVTLAGFHTLNSSMFDLAVSYRDRGMTVYAELQEREFQLERAHGSRAIGHPSFVGAGYFDALQDIVSGDQTATTELSGSKKKRNSNSYRWC